MFLLKIKIYLLNLHFSKMTYLAHSSSVCGLVTFTDIVITLCH